MFTQTTRRTYLTSGLNTPAKPYRFLDAMPASTAWINQQGEILVVNRAWRSFVQTNGILLGCADIGLNYLATCRESHGTERAQALAAARGIEDVLKGRSQEFSLEYACHSAQEQRWFRMVVSTLGPGQGAMVVHIDLTASRAAELNVQRLNSLYAVASGINEAIVRIVDEIQLYGQVCRIAVERDSLLMAWVGLVDAQSVAIRPVASWGEAEDFIDTVCLTTLAGHMGGDGPAGRAFRTGSHAFSNDIASETKFAGRDEALMRGFASCAAFAIKVAGQPVGIFALYAGETGFFDPEKLNLINALAENLSFAVESRRDEKRRRQMAEDLQLSQQRLTAAAAALEADHNEIARLNGELEQRVVERTCELQTANDDLEAFSYSIAHDLRSPLSSINGFGKLLERAMPADSPQASRHYLDRIRSGTTRMGEMIDALLALAQLSRTGLHLHDTDLSAIAKSVINALMEAEPDRMVQVEIVDGMRAHAASRLMRMVLENLMGNAWKFTARRENALISFGHETSADGETVYVVSDNGIGFDMAHAGKLFGVFERMHGSLDYAGTGVGLANVQRIISRHRGSIRATAILGEGATFRFTLGALANNG